MSKLIPRISIVLPNGASAEVRQSAPTKISQNDGVYQGDITILKVVTPNFSTPRTTTIRIYDKNGHLKYASSAIANNSTAASGNGTIYPAVPIPICDGDYVSAEPSGDPGGTGGTVTIDMEYKPDVFITL